MTLMPTFSERGDIVNLLDGEVNSRDVIHFTKNSTYGVPGFNKRGLQSVADVREGQTLVVAGGRQNVYMAGTAKGLAGQRGVRDQALENELELVITITPGLLRNRARPMEFQSITGRTCAGSWPGGCWQ